jgi:hypothetical protein
LVGCFSDVLAGEKWVGRFGAEQILVEQPLTDYEDVLILALYAVLCLEVPVQQGETDCEIAHYFFLLEFTDIGLQMV